MIVVLGLAYARPIIENYFVTTCNMESYAGHIVDVLNERIFPGKIIVDEGRIVEITGARKTDRCFIIPGFIDAHIHIESTLLPPSEFARIAVVHGTVAVVSDSHEIANVLGIDGVTYMIADARQTPFKCYFSAPSCVPATPFESGGGRLGRAEIERLCRMPEIKYLGEMMNFQGVIHGDAEVTAKIRIARNYQKKINGHAPGLTGQMLSTYISAGITTDHECTTESEALEKIAKGMKIQIREGSAAKNFDALIHLTNDHYKQCMFCSDDKHPYDLINGHINELVRRAIAYGIDPMKVLYMACVHPVLHYGLEVGLLQQNDPADFLIIDDLTNMNIKKTVINGNVVAENGQTLLKRQPCKIVNHFHVQPKRAIDFRISPKGDKIRVIEVNDGQLLTKKGFAIPKVVEGNVVSDGLNDILKCAVVNRYKHQKPAIGFAHGFKLSRGALASSISHDSHHIVAIGVTDEEICMAVNTVIQHRGGLCVVSKGENLNKILPLPIAGLMSAEDYSTVSQRFAEVNAAARSIGSELHSPFMTLSFLPLLVIPELRLCHRGLFDVEKFELVDLFLSV